jgi:hypothetical protein
VKVKSRERKDQSKSSPDTPLQRETIDFWQDYKTAPDEGKMVHPEWIPLSTL